MNLLQVGATVVVAAALTGCADHLVMLRYTPPPASTTLGPELVILPFVDGRGTEGDGGDMRRVGGVYGGYGNRIAKVMMTEPWPPRLMHALVAEFRATGVNARSGEGIPAGQILDVPRLETEVRNFSTEARWGRQAHIGAVLRLRGADGRGLVEKKLEVRNSGYNLNNLDSDLLGAMLNAAFARFVASVAGDLDIRAALATASPTGSPAAPPQQSPPAPPPVQSARPSSAAPPSLPGDAVSSFEAQLEALADLKARGRITEDEYQVMRRRLVEGARPESLAAAGASLSSPPPPRLQPAPLQWFLGNWQGRQWREGMGEVLTTLLDLKQVGHELRWELFTSRRQYMATGTATLIGERLELRGWYIGGSTPNRALSLTLTKTGETLEGTGRGTENLPFLASYQRRAP